MEIQHGFKFSNDQINFINRCGQSSFAMAFRIYQAHIGKGLVPYNPESYFIKILNGLIKEENIKPDRSARSLSPDAREILICDILRDISVSLKGINTQLSIQSIAMKEMANSLDYISNSTHNIYKVIKHREEKADEKELYE